MDISPIIKKPSYLMNNRLNANVSVATLRARTVLTVSQYADWSAQFIVKVNVKLPVKYLCIVLYSFCLSG